MNAIYTYLKKSIIILPQLLIIGFWGESSSVFQLEDSKL